MISEGHRPATTTCLCNAPRRASCAVSRLCDKELRGFGPRIAQHALLRRLNRTGKLRQRDLGELTSLDETTLTQNLRPLIDGRWAVVNPWEVRRQKLVRPTEACAAKLEDARPAWERATERLRSRLPEGPGPGFSIVAPTGPADRLT
jgi:DNA-binding MarR family transcriptional regulator